MGVTPAPETTVNGGALQLVLNILRRGTPVQQEAAEELAKTARPIGDDRRHFVCMCPDCKAEPSDLQLLKAYSRANHGQQLHSPASRAQFLRYARIGIAAVRAPGCGGAEA